MKLLIYYYPDYMIAIFLTIQKDIKVFPREIDL